MHGRWAVLATQSAQPRCCFMATLREPPINKSGELTSFRRYNERFQFDAKVSLAYWKEIAEECQAPQR